MSVSYKDATQGDRLYARSLQTHERNFTFSPPPVFASYFPSKMVSDWNLLCDRDRNEWLYWNDEYPLGRF
ncbi:hypothetical protein IQ235_05920 [Oscillatoriales cyanobacterium LEGE 11467]|uniref:Uncharacterized protein n=1 Tax=Zarconia navalis LEGE 11467 TaxID=1828826 RepID=A0A928Z847_9CYAN|nr:hypothetical protein [Zarconia navalis]MBE9040328.1 hypothetical protein [Zarconia navalis LEGE 11467]